MKLSLNWLQEYVALTVPPAEVSRAITFLGFEVEHVTSTGAPTLSDVVVGEVLGRAPHPNADRLSVCQVDVGPAGGRKTIVCGAQNYGVGDRVPVALPGAVLPGDFVIKQSKIRGQLSDGMLCSAAELGLEKSSEGLLILAGRPALGTPINAVLPPGDVIFDVEITPNRPDCLSHFGIARELAAWFRLPLVYPAQEFRGDFTGGPRPDLLSAVRVENPEDCPFYSAFIVTGVTIGPSPEWMQRRLGAVGVRAINNVVDCLNYVMLETGQPLHAFDAARIGGAEIVVRAAREGERLVTLDGRERELTNRMLVIADATRPLVVAGIMGGADAGVGAGTTDVVLESAVFRRGSVRATSRKLGLSSDSSYRYERGVDAHAALDAAWRAIDLLGQTAGGQPVGPSSLVGGLEPWEREITVDQQFIAARLGFDIPADEIRQTFAALELVVTREDTLGDDSFRWTVTVPSWRDDLDRPIDLVEEVLRLHGTEKIPTAVVRSPGLLAEDDPVVEFNREATRFLVGQDFNECVSYTLRGGAEIAKWVSQAAVVELALANPFSDDQSHLRPTLLLGLLDALKLNQARGVPVARLCEIGRTFVERAGRNYECCAAGFIMAEATGKHWLTRAPADFYTAKHLVTTLASLGGVDLERQPLGDITGPSFGWQENHSAGAGSAEVGWVGRCGLVNLALLRELGITGKVYAGIFATMPERLGREKSRRKFSEFSLQPFALRDVAVVVDEAQPAGVVAQAVTRQAREAVGQSFRLAGAEIFDVYRGAGLPPGRKSVACALRFQAPDRTLTDDEVGAAFARIVAGLKAEGYAIRE